MSNHRKLSILLTVIAFILPVYACIFAKPVSVSPTPTAVPTNDLPGLETQIFSAAATAEMGGKVYLEFTEGQLTAVANTELSNQGETRIKDIQISLQGGLITVTGLVNQNGLELPLSISLKINVDLQGKPHSQIVSGNIGPFSIPENMLSQITSQFDQMLASQFQAQGSDIFIESLTIDNGKIMIVAQKK
jgi:hypothetical protein